MANDRPSKKNARLDALAVKRKAPGKRLTAQDARKPRLSPAHQKVVDAYFANGCVSRKRAMLAAGYSEKSPTVQVFGRADVQEEIDRRTEARHKRHAATEERVIAEMCKLAFVNLGDIVEVNEDGSAYLDMSAMSEEHKASLVEFQTETYEEKQIVEPEEGNEDGGRRVIFVPVKKSKVKFASKQAALDSLARILGMFKDKVEVSGVQSLTERIAEARKRIHADKDNT